MKREGWVCRRGAQSLSLALSRPGTHRQPPRRGLQKGFKHPFEIERWAQPPPPLWLTGRLNRQFSVASLSSLAIRARGTAKGIHLYLTLTHHGSRRQQRRWELELLFIHYDRILSHPLSLACQHPSSACSTPWDPQDRVAWLAILCQKWIAVGNLVRFSAELSVLYFTVVWDLESHTVEAIPRSLGIMLCLLGSPRSLKA